MDIKEWNSFLPLFLNLIKLILDSSNESRDICPIDYMLYESDILDTPCDFTLSELWSEGSEAQWKRAINLYNSRFDYENNLLARSIEEINISKVASYNATEFYDFLYDWFLPWIAPAKGRLTITRKHLLRYKNEDKMEELDKIKNELATFNSLDIAEGFRIATSIHGFGVVGASGLLGILMPEKFALIDKFVLSSIEVISKPTNEKELCSINTNSVNIKHSLVVTEILRKKACDLNSKFDTNKWTPDKVGKILWINGVEDFLSSNISE